MTQHLYYLVLVLMGLAAAVFLFGVRPSSAAYEGTLLGGKLKLRGPIVVGALVVVGGYFFIPKQLTFPLTVFVHGEHGPQDIVLQNSGHVVLQLGPELRREAIGENGEAYFPAIPINFRGQEVPAWVDSDTYESVDTNTRQRLDGPSVFLIVRRKLSRYKLAGTVSDERGNPLPGVTVALPEYSVADTTNAYGRFELYVTADNQRMVDLVAEKQGYQTVRLSPTLGDSGVTFSIKPIR